MDRPLRLMCVVAHPDDESLGMGGTLARYAAEGVEVSIVCATRGERGRFGTAPVSPGLEVVGRNREAELRAAAECLGASYLRFLGYVDGELDQADHQEATRRIVHLMRLKRPDVVVTFAPDGAYGHPDHIAISQLTTAAVVAAADPFYAWDESWSMNGAPHRVKKLYYLAWSARKWDAYQSALKRLVSRVDGVERQACPWPDWSITTSLDATRFVGAVWQAICCHKTQMETYRHLAMLSAEAHRELWGVQQFYRAMSLVNGGRRQERDLFEGLRSSEAPVTSAEVPTNKKSSFDLIAAVGAGPRVPTPSELQFEETIAFNSAG